MDTNRLLEQNTLVVQEKVTMFANSYTLFDNDEQIVGSMREHRSIWRFLIKRAFAPFKVTCFDAEERPIATLSKKWAFLAPHYTITDCNGMVLGSIRSKVTLVKPKADLFDNSGNPIGSMEGDWTAWDFKILDRNGDSLATINKEFNGFIKEMFTTADKYRISINPMVKDSKLRMTILFTACAIDMILKEN